MKDSLSIVISKVTDSSRLGRQLPFLYRRSNVLPSAYRPILGHSFWEGLYSLTEVGKQHKLPYKNYVGGSISIIQVYRSTQRAPHLILRKVKKEAECVKGWRITRREIEICCQVESSWISKVYPASESTIFKYYLLNQLTN